jgi:SAM-dependent methyltransferase
MRYRRDMAWKLRFWRTDASQSAAAPGLAPVLESSGTCTTCGAPSRFVAVDPWLRDHFVCERCGSIPRERALMATIDRLYPHWRQLAIHESSPAERGASARLRRECAGYTASAYSPGLARGGVHPTTGMRNEDLEALSFPDESFDLVVTQDVVEHVFDAPRVFSEIARVLRPGGAHVFTVPLLAGAAASRVVAERAQDGSVIHHVPAVHHGSPTGEGALVTWHWGFDIAEHVYRSGGLVTSFVFIDDLSRGIRAEFIDVLVSRKPVES